MYTHYAEWVTNTESTGRDKKFKRYKKYSVPVFLVLDWLLKCFKTEEKIDIVDFKIKSLSLMKNKLQLR
jgi:hypothetical protein